MTRERGDHMIIAIALPRRDFLAIVASILTGFSISAESVRTNAALAASVASALRRFSETRGGSLMMRQAILAGAVVIGLAAAPVFAADDEALVMKIAKGGMAEVELGKLAAEKASSDAVKQFGQRMVDDHSKANDELKALAQNKKITLPTEIGPEEKALRDRLVKLSGPAFDQAYMKAMLNDHSRTSASSGRNRAAERIPR